MSITVNRKKLAKALERIYGIKAKADRMPILQDFLLRCDLGDLEVYATDLTVVGRVTVPVVSRSDGGKPLNLAVKAVKLKRAVAALTANDAVVLEVVKAKRPGSGGIEREVPTLLVSGPDTGTAYVLDADDGAEFPSVKMAGGDPLSVPAEDLLAAIRATAYAISTDETRYNLNGLRIEPKGGGTLVVATDGHRMAVAEVECPVVMEAATVPREAVPVLRKMLGAERGDVAVRSDADSVGFEAGGLRLSARKLEGLFPDWQRIVPRATDRGFITDAEDLAASLRRVVALADDKEATVTVVVSRDGDSSVQVRSLGTMASEIIAVTTAEGFEFSAREAYLFDAVRNLAPGALRVQVGENDALDPIRISRDEDGGPFAVVMPVRT